MSEFSVFRSIRELTPCTTRTVEEFISHIKDGTYAELVGNVRAATDKKQRTAAKALLPVVTIGGTFSQRSNTGSEQYLTAHSGLICMDFDEFPDGMDLDTARSLLYVDPFTYCGFISAGGNGIALIIRIPADVTLHRDAYVRLSEYYLRQYGLKTDAAPKNVASLRYLSYDPDIYVNDDSVLFPVTHKNEGVKPRECDIKLVGVYDKSGNGPDINFVMSEIRARRHHLADSYNDWVKLGFALAVEYGEGGFDLFNEISSYYTTYDERATRKQYDHCLRGRNSGVTIATLWWLCKQAGIPLYPPRENRTQPGRKPKAKKAEDEPHATGKPYLSEVPKVSPQPEELPKHGTDRKPSANVPEDHNRHFAVLGYYRRESEQLYVFFDKASRQVIERSASSLSRMNLLQLAPFSYWAERYPDKRYGFDSILAAEWVMNAAKRAGIFSPSKLRGRGAWIDGTDVVIHNGNRLIVNGASVSIGEYNTEYVYEAGESLGFDVDRCEPLTSKEAYEYFDLTRFINFDTEINRYLFIGWCVIAPVCGALRWRPHLWLTGESGSGKSWIFHEIVRAMLGRTALSVQGETSSAGIRQVLRMDALNPVFDEAFKEDSTDSQRLKDIISLARTASFEDGGIVAKGTVSQSGKSYLIRSCFALASITDFLQQNSDRSRFAVVNIIKRNDPAQFEELKRRAFALMKPEQVNRLHARTVQILPTILKNIETFAFAAAQLIGSTRDGDQIGTLLAGAYSLHSSKEITPEDAVLWVSRYTWSDEEEAKEERDELRILRIILSEIVLISAGGGARKRSVGELIQIAAGLQSDNLITLEDADLELRRIGIKCKDGGVSFANNHPRLVEILTGTAFERNYHKVLLLIDGACPAAAGKYAGVTSRGVYVPLSHFGSPDNVPVARDDERTTEGEELPL